MNGVAKGLLELGIDALSLCAEVVATAEALPTVEEPYRFVGDRLGMEFDSFDGEGRMNRQADSSEYYLLSFEDGRTAGGSNVNPFRLLHILPRNIENVMRRVQDGTCAFLEELDSSSASDFVRLLNWLDDVRSGEESHSHAICEGGQSRSEEALPSMRLLLDEVVQSSHHPLIKALVFAYRYRERGLFESLGDEAGCLWETKILLEWKPFPVWYLQDAMYCVEGMKVVSSEENGDSEMTFICSRLRQMVELLWLERGGLSVRTQKREMIILEEMKEHPTVTTKQLAERLEISDRTIDRILAKCKREGKIERRGSRRSGHWVVLDEVD